jgi:tripartite-type tricarboxylate transporter receptor subunit TctC
MRSTFRVAAAVLFALSALPLLAQTQARAQAAFPTKTVKFLIPFPAGGINDILARIIADKLQAKWGQPIVIENKPGAGGNIGADLAYQARPIHTRSSSARADRHQPDATSSPEMEEFVPITPSPSAERYRACDLR